MKFSKASVVIVQRIVPYYRLPFFKMLTIANRDINIKVYHGDTKIKNADSVGFETQCFKTYSRIFFGFSLIFQPALVFNVLLTKPELLILEGTFGIITNFVLVLLRKTVGLPTLYWTAGWSNPDIIGWRATVKSIFIRFNLFLCSGAIVYGSAARDYLISLGLSERKIFIAQNTIDVESLISKRFYWLEQGKLVRQKYLPKMGYVISYVGHLSPMKRVRILLEAFNNLNSKNHKFSLLIVGAGKQEVELKRFVKLNNISDVIFVGEVIEDVEAYFAASDLFVLPGTGGLALNQAMALGLPVVATVADGTHFDLIDSGKNGYIVLVDDVVALESAIENIFFSSEKRRQMGNSSLRIIKSRASLRNMVEKYSQAIQHFLSYHE